MFIHIVQFSPLPIMSQMPSISVVKLEHMIAARVFFSVHWPITLLYPSEVGSGLSRLVPPMTIPIQARVPSWDTWGFIRHGVSPFASFTCEECKICYSK